jgi:membrane-bound serine protease (ClpP class)
MRRALSTLLPLLLLAVALESPADTARIDTPGTGAPLVVRALFDDQTVTPVTARFLRRAIRDAESAGAAALVIELDTPGGLADSARETVRDLLSAGIPVVVYVAPPGARAASAGLFVTLAADVAAMAPGTNIGAAHPVQIGGLPAPDEEEADQPGAEPGIEKVVQDTRAWVRALAEARGRNANAAERAVVESLSYTADEALAEGIIDLVATDLGSLLDEIDGRVVQRGALTFELSTRGATIQTVELDRGQRVLAVLSNPNVAFLLLILGFYALIFEIISPGFGIAGIIGLGCLLLAFTGLAVLPLSWFGLLLIVAAVGLFVAEAFVPSFGLLTVAGVVCLVTGGLLLVDSPEGFMRVSLAAIVPIAATSVVIALFLLRSVVRAHRRRVQTGTEQLASAIAVADEDFAPAGAGFRGRARVHGEYWSCESVTPVARNQPLRVVARRGLILAVEPIAEAQEPPPTQPREESP